LTFFAKSILALPLVGFAVLNLMTMFEMLGRTDRKFDPKILRLIHRISGVCYVIVFVIISYYCINIMRASGQELAARGALHGLLSVTAFLLLALKISFVRIYRKYFSSVALLGITVVMLTLCTTAISAGYYLVLRTGKPAVSENAAATSDPAGYGSVVFQENCADCHYHDKTETKIGPGLIGLFKRDKLPVSGKPVTEADVINQLKTPVDAMPPFPELTDEEIQALVSYLKSL
jgi:mono/diheme cytochrome c family protein